MKKMTCWNCLEKFNLTAKDEKDRKIEISRHNCGNELLMYCPKCYQKLYDWKLNPNLLK
jgi:hypothetical protein